MELHRLLLDLILGTNHLIFEGGGGLGNYQKHYCIRKINIDIKKKFQHTESQDFEQGEKNCWRRWRKITFAHSKIALPSPPSPPFPPPALLNVSTCEKAFFFFSEERESIAARVSAVRKSNANSRAATLPRSSKKKNAWWQVRARSKEVTLTSPMTGKVTRYVTATRQQKSSFWQFYYIPSLY